MKGNDHIGDIPFSTESLLWEEEYLEDHPRTWIRGDRITPIGISHENMPFGKGSHVARSLGDENDDHGLFY